jgi:hypothetical protein
MKTNSKLKLCTVIALVLFPLLANEKAFAQNLPNQTPPDATGVLAQQTTGLTTFTIDVTTTTTFVLTLNITTTFLSNGITYFLETGANGSGFFALTGRANNDNLYDDVTNGDGAVTTNPFNQLNPVNDLDLGATNTPPVFGPDPAGTYLVATLTLSINTGAPGFQFGTYTIFLDSRRIIADDQNMDHALNVNTITINIIPEPATAGLAVLGGVMLLGFIWRARRVMA